jgi:hypothetical protein
VYHPFETVFFLNLKPWHPMWCGESLIKCELSDMCDFIKPDEEPGGQDGHLLIMKVHQGKTSQHTIIRGIP